MGVLENFSFVNDAILSCAADTYVLIQFFRVY